MPIYAIQVSNQALQDPNNFEEAKDEKQGGFAASSIRHQTGSDKGKSTVSFFASLGFLATAAILKSGLCCKLASIAGVLSADSTYRYSRALCKATPNTRKVLTTENVFATTAIVGAFPDDIIREIKANTGRRTPHLSQALKIASKSTSVISAVRALEGTSEGVIPCLDRVGNFFQGDDPGSRLAGATEFNFEVNPNRQIYSRQPNILYIVSDKPMEQVFSGGDYALSPPRNGTLKVFRSIEDAIDSHNILVVTNDTHRPTHRR